MMLINVVVVQVNVSRCVGELNAHQLQLTMTVKLPPVVQSLFRVESFFYQKEEDI